MRKYSDEILDEIRMELTFIWAIQKVFHLEGKMRVYAPIEQENWTSHEAGFEMWFGNDPDEISEVIKKIKLYYNANKKPNTPFFLDPVVYAPDKHGRMAAAGTVLTWCTILCDENQDLDDAAIKRVKDLGVYIFPLHLGNTARKGLKVLGFLKEPILPKTEDISADGTIIPGIQDMSDLANINGDGFHNRNYMLSGLVYNHPEYGSYQHPSFNDFLKDIAINEPEEIKEHTIFVEYLIDAGICWNAYERDEAIYDRYGIDAQNLESNLERKIKSDAEISEIKKELYLLCSANKRLNLEGDMRLYTVPNQDIWRSKKSGVEVYVNSENIDKAIRELQLYNNAGLLPNSPMLLDPVTYIKDSDGVYIPHGCSVIWTTALATGLYKVSNSSLERMKELGLYTGIFIRAGEDESGIKVIGFLDKPYLFTEEEKAKYIEEYIKEDFTEEEIKLELEQTGASLKNGRDAPEIRGCKELFDIIDVNAIEFYKYYCVTGVEYLCTNGAFANTEMCEEIATTDEAINAQIEKYTVNLANILAAARCWESYDRINDLWCRFGIDENGLDVNLKNYNLCGRNIDLLNLVSTGKDDSEKVTFDFFVPGWLPKGIVTLVCSTEGVDKSALVHKLAVAAASNLNDDDRLEWLGKGVNKDECKSLAIYFAGEDSEAIMNSRSEAYDPDKKSVRMMFKLGNDFGKNAEKKDITINDFLLDLDILPDVSLVVIDSVHKYVIGDENNSETIGHFFDSVERFAMNKNCAVVVVYNHVTKNTEPKDHPDILNYFRGADEFIDRPQVILSLIKRGGVIEAGFAKNILPPGLDMVEGTKSFKMSEDGMEFIPI